MYEDTVYSVEHMPDDIVVLTFTKWRLYGDVSLDRDRYPDIHQRPQEDGSIKFLCADDDELTALQAACSEEGIRLGVPENIELTAERKQFLTDYGFSRREGMEIVIRRGERIRTTTSISELQDELLKMR